MPQKLCDEGVGSSSSMVTASQSNSCAGVEIKTQTGSVLSHYPFHRHNPSEESLKLPLNVNLSHINGKTSLIAHNRGCDSALMPESVCVSGKQVNKVCTDRVHTNIQKMN